MLRQVADQLAVALEAIEVPDLQVYPRMVSNPSPPTLDIYQADPSQEDAAFGPDSSLTLWTIRARVTTIDQDANQDLALDLCEPAGPTSVRGAILADKTLGGLAEGLDIERPTGLREYPGDYLGCEWRVRIYTNGGPPG